MIKLTDPDYTVTSETGDLVYQGKSYNQSLSEASQAGEGIYKLSTSNTSMVVGEPYIPPLEPGQSIIEAQAQTMIPGEWRNIEHLTTWPGKDEGISFKSFQVVYHDTTDDPITDGMGWTQDICYKNGRLLMLLMRSNYPDLMVMEPDGRFWKTMDVQGARGGGRRPFNRLAQDDEYMYYFPAQIDDKNDIGSAVKMSMSVPDRFTSAFDSGFNYQHQDSSGNFAVVYVPEWGRFYSFAQQGFVRSIAIGETEWTIHGQTPEDGYGVAASGYAPAMAWNPVRGELAMMGGQTFGSTPPCGHRWVIMNDPYGPIIEMPDLVDTDGNQLHITSAQDKLFYDPRDGAWLLNHDGINIVRSLDGSSPWVLYENLQDVGSPFGNYECYAPQFLVPGTDDVYVFLSHIRGLVLHRLKDLAHA